jgi:hypothetical protein
VDEEDGDPRTLLERQWLFSDCLGELLAYAKVRGYKITLAEVGLQQQRKALTGQVFSDGVHMIGSLHYARLAADLNLWVNGERVISSEHYGYLDLGNYWLARDPLCRWGGRFKQRDSNHFSVAWLGKS